MLRATVVAEPHDESDGIRSIIFFTGCCMLSLFPAMTAKTHPGIPTGLAVIMNTERWIAVVMVRMRTTGAIIFSGTTDRNIGKPGLEIFYEVTSF